MIYDGLHMQITECRCHSIHHLTIESPEEHLGVLMVRSRGLQLQTSVRFALTVTEQKCCTSSALQLMGGDIPASREERENESR